jgi:hypothetical protein
VVETVDRGVSASHCASRRFAWRRLSSLVTVAMLATACAGPVTPDLVITNARVFTNDAARPWAEALAIKGERVIAVGSSVEVRAAANAATRVVDAGGRVVVPGFNDARVDLPPEPPTPAGLAALDRAAIARGVTSLQVVAGGPMRSLVEAARQATRQARWRLIRSPEDAGTLSTTDPTATVRDDEKPFLPPQPGMRLLANGMAWRLPDGRRDGRRTIDPGRVETVVGWAYGAEDPIVMSGGARHWVAALSRIGLPDVWQRKRPRFDVDAADDPAQPSVFDPGQIAAFRRLGVVVMWTPEAVGGRAPRPGPGPFSNPWHYPGSFVDGGLRLSIGSAGPPAPALAIALAVGAGGRASGRPLTREEAVRAATWGSAFAEKAERDKGWFGQGTLADLAILSDDVFTVLDDDLPSITSVLTVVGGTIVYDPGVLPK